MSTTTPRGSYRKGERKRSDILEAALNTIATSGFTNASIQQIADAVGITKAGVLHHFASREELLVEVLRRRDALAVERAGESDTIHGFLDTMRANAEVPGLVALYTAMAATVETDPDSPSRRFFTERYPTVISLVRQAIEERQRRGEVPQQLDAERVARLIIAAADGLQTQWLVDPSVDMVGHLQYFWDVLVGQSRGDTTS
ncbi:TetR/AcrR family transcriptional regulator [Herbiconiux sp. SYSU D00978]|uniref:TetR/AcrR family transcriptional regulator n=1 Tax=Herbiconiux sp. SYSU D00978 TaxID=2812562 RepID=UPI001A97B12D|nr:TetR family transcriptional regulator [Herbiconiux sp. SYSU D00978]